MKWKKGEERRGEGNEGKGKERREHTVGRGSVEVMKLLCIQ